MSDLARYWHGPPVRLVGAAAEHIASLRTDQAPSPSERVTGIEPALSAWEADVLPLNYTRVVRMTRLSDPTAADGAPLSGPAVMGALIG